MSLLGVDDAALSRIITVARKSVRIGSPEWVDIETMIAAGLVSDLAVDTVARAAPADANSEAEQVAIFDRLGRAIDRAPQGQRPTVWVCAHTKKGDSKGLESVSGSTQRTGQADSVLIVVGEKDVRKQTISSTVTAHKLRHTPDEYPAPCQFAILRHGADWQLQTAGVQDSDTRALDLRILELLRTGAKTKSAMSADLGRNKDQIDVALTPLFRSGAIETCQIRQRGKNYRGYQLASSAPVVAALTVGTSPQSQGTMFAPGSTTPQDPYPI
jgi:hypothetical protein